MSPEDTALTVPKAELHLHIEGALEPELAFECARRNGITLPYADVADLRRRYDFSDLQSFLGLYYTGMDVLRTRQDFTDLTDSYLDRARKQGVRHAEIFFDPQAHTTRGVALETVLDGLEASLATSEQRFGVTTRLIACFLRDHGPDSAMATFDELLPHAHKLTGVGLDSAEAGFPPDAFAPVFDRAREAGLRLVAHAGEEGPPEYVWQALDVLGVDRVDHGIRAVEDTALLRRIARDQVPLTVCPLSNVRLRCVDTLDEHCLPRLVDTGVLTTLNSDDPSYFGGYVGDNFHAVRQELGFDDAALREFAANSVRASFLGAGEQDRLLREITG
ncbi:adenosine deaminase [Saccharopolyspora lacisalsi]|uniref:Adenine deaminase n=1 Tax=Halosaccharopolyspora lacisalsi TaxID=1000566 RepID=A0A839DV89_9PSEU|nr:adenosine deaminase [Halosaccharopolyspora lacisalsi]MBA8823307.1 adenosine deaminase [Halosaccharopolyspora lacisalsi]